MSLLLSAFDVGDAVFAMLFLLLLLAGGYDRRVENLNEALNG